MLDQTNAEIVRLAEQNDRKKQPDFTKDMTKRISRGCNITKKMQDDFRVTFHDQTNAEIMDMLTEILVLQEELENKLYRMHRVNITTSQN